MEAVVLYLTFTGNSGQPKKILRSVPSYFKSMGVLFTVEEGKAAQTLKNFPKEKSSPWNGLAPKGPEIGRSQGLRFVVAPHEAAGQDVPEIIAV